MSPTVNVILRRELSDELKRRIKYWYLRNTSKESTENKEVRFAEDSQYTGGHTLVGLLGLVTKYAKRFLSKTVLK